MRADGGEGLVVIELATDGVGNEELASRRVRRHAARGDVHRRSEVVALVVQGVADVGAEAHVGLLGSGLGHDRLAAADGLDPRWEDEHELVADLVEGTARRTRWPLRGRDPRTAR